MSSNKARGFESVDSEGVKYTFRGNFAFLQSLRDTSEKSLFRITETIAEGDPEDIRDVLMCSLVGLADGDVEAMTSEVKQETIEDFITRHGLQECSILANTMLTNAMVGDIKKNRIDRHQKVMSLLNNSMISRSKAFRNHVMLWGYVGMISGVCAWLSIKLLENPIV